MMMCLAIAVCQRRPNAMFNPSSTSPVHQTHLDESLVRDRSDAFWPVVLHANCLRFLWHGGLTLDVDGLALCLCLLLPPRVLLDSLDEFFSASAGADVLCVV